MKKNGFDLRKFDKLLAQLTGKKNSPILRAVYNQWGVRYLAETKRYFVRNSNGGGEWKPLKRRRSRGSLKSAKILRDTGTLFKALNIGNPGNLYQDLKNGKRVGFGGQGGHPSGRISIVEIARIHQSGHGPIPKRAILHKPSNKLIVQMLRDLSQGVKNIGRGL